MVHENPNASAVLERTDEEIRKRFEELLERWKRETAFLSSTTQRANHPAYQGIIGLGPKAVPLLLDEVKREPCDLFWALHAITGEDLVVQGDRGNMQKMAQSWLEWGAGSGRRRLRPHSLLLQRPLQ